MTNVERAIQIGKAADRAVATYDAYVFGATWPAFNSARADTLGLIAAVCCDQAAEAFRGVASSDRVNYLKLAAQMRALCA